MPKIDKKKFHETLARDAAWQGDRCKDACNSEDGDIVACAITVSQLVHLRSMASHKLLSEHDIQVAIDAFIEAAGMEEKTQPMGGTVFVRKEPATA